MSGLELRLTGNPLVHMHRSNHHQLHQYTQLVLTVSGRQGNGATCRKNNCLFFSTKFSFGRSLERDYTITCNYDCMDMSERAAYFTVHLKLKGTLSALN